MYTQEVQPNRSRGIVSSPANTISTPIPTPTRAALKKHRIREERNARTSMHTGTNEK